MLNFCWGGWVFKNKFSPKAWGKQKVGNFPSFIFLFLLTNDFFLISKILKDLLWFFLELKKKKMGIKYFGSKGFFNRRNQ